MSKRKYDAPNRLLLDAAKHGELVVFVGAGASMLCGSPDWRGFSNRVVDALDSAGALSFLESEQLRGLGDPRRTLSIAMALAKENGVAIDFDHILHPTRPSEIGIELYELLSKLRPIFVTTNYDKWLDNPGPNELSDTVKEGNEAEPAERPNKRPKYYLRDHLSPALLAERGAVVHLHGSYTDPSSMVVSLRDYIEHYADARVQAFLSAMFKNFTVLFVGYGLAELEVLDQIIRTNESARTGSTEPRHFLLYAYRSTEVAQTRFIEHFFRDQCGVCVVPYCIDEKGYREVVDVFKTWSTELEIRDPSILDLQSHLDRYIESPDPVNRDAALRLVRNRPELASYFVNLLKDPVWFPDLDGAGFFNAENNPKVSTIENERGTMYQAEGWPALRYLEQIVAVANVEHAKRIAEILRTISKDAEHRNPKNWRTSWSLATVLAQLPLDVLTDSDIDMIDTWFSGQRESSMLGAEIGQKLLPRLLDSSDQCNWKRALRVVDILSRPQRTEEAS